MINLYRTLSILLSLSLLSACGGSGGDHDEEQTTSLTEGTQLFYLTEHSGMYHLNSVALDDDYTQTQLSESPLPYNDFLSSFAFNAVDTQPEHLMLWLENDALFGARESQLGRFQLYNKAGSEELCTFSHVVTEISAEGNAIGSGVLVRTVGSDLNCNNADDQYELFNIGSTITSQSITTAQAMGLKGAPLPASSTNANRYTRYSPASGQTAIFDRSTRSTIATYDFSLPSGSMLSDGTEYYWVDGNTLSYADIASLINGSLPSVSTMEIDGISPSADYHFSQNGDNFYLYKEDALRSLDVTTGLSNELLAFSFEDITFATWIDGERLLIQNQLSNGTYEMHIANIETEEVTMIISNPDTYMSVAVLNEKVWVTSRNRYDEPSAAYVYDIETEALTTYDNANWDHLFFSGALSENEIVLVRHRTTNIGTESTISVRDKANLSEAREIGSYDVPYFFLANRGNTHRLITDHDRFQLFIADFSQANSLVKVGEASGIIRFPY